MYPAEDMDMSDDSSRLLALPTELQLLILEQLPRKDQYKLMRVCHPWSSFLSDVVVRARYERQHFHLLPGNKIRAWRDTEMKKASRRPHLKSPFQDELRVHHILQDLLYQFGERDAKQVCLKDNPDYSLKDTPFWDQPLCDPPRDQAWLYHSFGELDHPNSCKTIHYIRGRFRGVVTIGDLMEHFMRLQCKKQYGISRDRDRDDLSIQGTDYSEFYKYSLAQVMWRKGDEFQMIWERRDVQGEGFLP